MSTQLIKRDDADKIEKVLIGGDLKTLTPEERVSYYRMVCESVGLNPLTKPFEYITLNGKLTLYALKNCTDQLRSVHQVSVEIVAREVTDDCYVVTATAKTPTGRTDASIGAVSIGGLKGEAKCNSLMKAETKAKRRVTLSICGLGMLDETEIESIPENRRAPAAVTTEVIEIKRKQEIGSETVNREPLRGGSLARPAQEGGTVDAPDRFTAEQTDLSSSAGVKQHASVTAVKHPTAGNDGPRTPSEPVTNSAGSPAVEYININQQKNFHIKCREAVRPEKKMAADDLTYVWLGENGYRDKDGLPTASLIPAAGWMKIRDRACEWLKTQ